MSASPAIAPALPARRPRATSASEHSEEILVSTQGSNNGSPSRIPPALPPRQLPNMATPQVVINAQSPVMPTVETSNTSPKVLILPEPPMDTSNPAIALTPATPPQSNSPVDKMPSLIGQLPQAKPAPSEQSTQVSFENPTVTSRLADLPAEPSQPLMGGITESISLPTTQTLLSFPSSSIAFYTILFLLLLNLSRPIIGPLWMALLAGGVFGYRWLVQQDAKVAIAVEDRGRIEGAGGDSVKWVNHALYALFPLISTDVLTPFIDLMEDALIQQVPPIVTSVRLTSAALGTQPVLLTSLQPLSDQDWFASLSAKPHAHKPSGRPKSSSISKSPMSTSTFPPSKPTHKHTRSTSASTLGSFKRSASASSLGSSSGLEQAQETTRRRKRDRILQKVSRQRSSGVSGPNHDNSDLRNGEEEPVLMDGERRTGGVGGETDEDDPNSGQYVNFTVGFEYKRTESSRSKGFGLHVLAYFGWGVKGVAKSEIPVYIDVLGIKGTVNLRLLLSATPPFVRTGTFSLSAIPDFDIAATPMIPSGFNAMHLPGMKSYVQASIKEVCGAFVRPSSYTLDVDRLLLGREENLRTHAVGVLHIIIHGAEDLPKADTMGTCDPYLAISFTKFNKPMYSTRTIIDNQNPVWEEDAFLLISADAIESGEKIRLRLCDSDRFSADDAMGVVEVDLADLIDHTTSTDRPSSSDTFDHRNDALEADSPGMKVTGTLSWSVRFCPLWVMPESEMQKRMEKNRSREKRREPEYVKPVWLDWLESFMDKPDWEDETKERRKETVAWFTGEKEKDEMEAASRPNDQLRSGVLQFHIHQCNDLEVESLDGTYSSSLDHRKSAVNGKPALADVTDRTPTENPEPPSAYCEVHLNDNIVYRTRTKQVTPLPYFNAVSERFIRDWRMAKIVFVVRDERDREHDPILGLVEMRLKDAFADRSQFTRWFPLVGGLGWGRIRISLLWKPIDMDLPPRISGYQAATLEIKSVTATDFGRDKNMSIRLETESDRAVLRTPGDDSLNANQQVAGPSVSTASLVNPGAPEIQWEVEHPIRLAVEYRHSCSVLISFVTKSVVLKKKRILGLAMIRLDDCADYEEVTRRVPVFKTELAKEAVKASAAYWAQQSPSQSQPQSNSGGSRVPPSPSPSPAQLIGFITLTLIVHPGLSRTHQKLCKRDLRFRQVYEAWEMAREVDQGLDQLSVKENLRSTKMRVLHGHGHGVDGSAHGQQDELEGESDYSESDDEGEVEGLRRRRSDASGKSFQSLGDEEGGSERKAHAHALHKRNKGIFQLKIARTGRYVKDKLEAKLYSSGKERHGADLEIEQEGQSSL